MNDGDKARITASLKAKGFFPRRRAKKADANPTEDTVAVEAVAKKATKRRSKKG